ncbi:MAG TPA: ubiquinone/menaquinone biosynthesis methyltransferase [Thermomicrobiales bacterium]|nr:ubiquinone/menaquinone biosynthesis methyltransferase [Thermomicrobiales bacterium]
MTLPTDAEKAGYVRSMFGRIVGRYDLLNDLMTAGQHRHWKRLAARAAVPQGALALDLGCGTGDLTRALSRQGARLVAGADFVPEMLVSARQQAAAQGVAGVAFIVADALCLPFVDATFDRVTSGFLVRNVADPEAAFREMRRVLKPGGLVVCLEASRRDDRLGRALRVGFGVLARGLGRLVAGDAAAYAYLPDSAAAFARPAELAATMERAGFMDVRYRRLGLGMIAIHRGSKPGGVASGGVAPSAGAA